MAFTEAQIQQRKRELLEGKSTTEFFPKTTEELLKSSQAEVERTQAMLAQTEAEGEKPFAGSSFEQALTSRDLIPQPMPTLPQPKTDTTNYNAQIDNGNAIIGANGAVKTEAEPTSDLATQIKALQDSLNAPLPSLETAYQTASEQAGIESAKQVAATKQARVKSAQSELAGIQAQIQGVISKRDANNLLLEKQASAGQVTGTILGRQQQESNRQAAIEALPLQALALAKQAEVAGLQGEAEYAQSTLKLAQDRLDTAFKLKSQDIENEYNYKKENRKAVYDFLTDEQKRRADAKQKQADQEFTTQQNNLNNAQALSIKAMENGQPDIAAKITQLDPKSKTFVQDLANLQAQIKITPTSGVAGNYVPGTNPTVDNWAKLIISGQASITQVPNPKGSTLRSDVVDAITSSGQLLLSDKDREKLNVLDTAFNVYETIKRLSDKINTFDVTGRVTGYLSRYLGGATQMNVDIARYNAARQGFVSNVARTLGEKGTLAEGDVQRAISNLPTINDTQAVAQGKLETLKSILESAKTSIIQKSTQPLNQTTSGTLGSGSEYNAPSGNKYLLPY